MSNISTLSNYLRMHRKRGAFSQGEFAYLLGSRDRSNISRYETGERTPSLEKLIGYEVISGNTIKELFPGTYASVMAAVLKRARQLSRKIDARPLTPVNKQKFDALVEITHPKERRRVA